MKSNTQRKHEIIDNIISFIEENENELAPIICKDLKLKNIDEHESQIYDSVNNKYYDVSVSDIVIATLKRAKIAIKTFK